MERRTSVRNALITIELKVRADIWSISELQARRTSLPPQIAIGTSQRDREREERPYWRAKDSERERGREKEGERKREREEANPGNIDPIYGVFLSLTEETTSITTFRNYLRVCSRGGGSSYRVSRVWLLALGSAVDQVGTWVVDTSGRICRYRRPLKRCPPDTSTQSGDGDLQNRERCHSRS